MGRRVGGDVAAGRSVGRDLLLVDPRVGDGKVVVHEVSINLFAHVDCLENILDQQIQKFVQWSLVEPADVLLIKIFKCDFFHVICHVLQLKRQYVIRILLTGLLDDEVFKHFMHEFVENALKRRKFLFYFGDFFGMHDVKLFFKSFCRLLCNPAFGVFLAPFP